jgi:hypothetical protein
MTKPLHHIELEITKEEVENILEFITSHTCCGGEGVNKLEEALITILPKPKLTPQEVKSRLDEIDPIYWEYLP